MRTKLYQRRENQTTYSGVVWACQPILTQLIPGDGCYFSKTTVYNAAIPPTVDRYNSDCRSQHIGRGAGPVPTDIPTDSVDRRSINSNNISTEYRPICRPTYIGRVSVDMSADCWSTYRPRVSTDTRSTDALSTHDPIYLSFGLLKAVPNDIGPKKKRSTCYAVPVPFHPKEGNDFSVFALCSRTRTPHIWYQIFQEKPGFLSLQFSRTAM